MLLQTVWLILNQLLERAIKHPPSSLREETMRRIRSLMGGASKVIITDKGKAKFMGAQGKGTKPNFTCFIVIVLTLLGNV